MHPERRYAEWRPTSGFRIPAVIIGTTVGILTALAVSILIVLVCGRVKSLTGYSVPGISSMFAFAISAATAHAVIRRINERRAASLRDAPDDGQFAVSAMFRREVRYGFDGGLIAFADGWLIYSGRQCSFSIRKSDVLRYRLPDRKVIIEFLGPHHKHFIEFRGADGFQLGVAVRAWMHGPEAEGEAILPPIVPEQNAVGLMNMSLGAGAVLATLALVLCFAPNPTTERLFLAIFFVGLPALALLWFGIEMRQAHRQIAGNLPMRKDFLTGPLGLQFAQSEKARQRELQQDILRENLAKAAIEARAAKRKEIEKSG